MSQLDIFKSSQEGRAAAAPRTGFLDAIKAGTLDRPTMVSLGLGVDSVAMTIALIQLGHIPSAIYFADVGAERPETYAYLDVFNAWLEPHGVQITVARYLPTNAPYDTLTGELHKNGTIPGVSMGIASCSIKWKQTAIHNEIRGMPAKGRRPALPGWQAALDCWARGERVVKFIGFDAGSKDRRRSGPTGDAHYEHVYLLRELGMDRLDCARLIKSAGLPIPLKSSCFFCGASKEQELRWLHHYHPSLFREALVIETRAMPKLTKSEGLWRHTRISDGRPGNWRLWAERAGLLVEDPAAPDGFRLVPQSNPPLHYPDDEIGHLLAAEQSLLKAA
ncbi:hypothetical protein [Sphingosinicella sp. BN140058]|uniref:hypothetical protein n=1 Tax=Sphingosinicella sp. BN140058 TaxID=1892855 RepID=UPI0010138699|nr:hypothetical protein [Sphingosinicella sp. BN140058]QAY80116.1 hypothetical protein ETR14_26095 [Sphingosinicella sp. BN140058]